MAHYYEHPEAIVDPHDKITLIEKDYRLVLPLLPVCDVVLTDPPYMWYLGILDLEAKGYYARNPLAGVWPLYSWMAQWFPLLLARVKHAIWFTTDRRYLQFYRHFLSSHLTMQDWPLLYDKTLEAHLVHIGPAPVEAPDEATLAQFQYGSDSPVAFWAGILRVTPGEHGLLLDPFCGTGSALEAGLQAGYKVVGVEMEPRTFKRLQTRMIALSGSACQDTMTSVYFGPTGPRTET